MLYLASQSPRRQSLLKELQVSFDLLLPEAHEDTESLEQVLPGEAALDYVRRVTLLKLEAAVKRIEGKGLKWAPILCADTTVALRQGSSDLILGKPVDSYDALQMLTLLNHQCHDVHTAIALQIHPHQPPECLVSSSKVFFADHDAEKLQAYVATQEPMGKAGAYAIQGLGGALIAKIEGSHSSIMGLPLYETSVLLEKAGITYILYP
jgi:septum formation protein